MNEKSKKTAISLTLTTISLILIFFNNQSYKREKEFKDNYARSLAEASDRYDNLINGLDHDTDIHGNISDNIYDNSVVQLSFRIPDNWNVWQIDEMNEYCDSLDSYRRHVIDPNKRDWLMGGDEYYDLICTDDENHLISIIFVSEINYNSTSCVEIEDYIINEIVEESQREFDNNPNVTSAIHNPAIFGFVDNQQVYLIEWTIENSDGTIKYRTEIIDYANPCIRVIAIEYDDPSEFDEIASGISYYGGNEEPNTLNTIQTQQ